MPEILQWLPDWGIQVPSHSIRGHLVSASSSGLVPYHALPCPGPSSKACDIWVPAPSLDVFPLASVPAATSMPASHSPSYLVDPSLESQLESSPPGKAPSDCPQPHKDLLVSVPCPTRAAESLRFTHMVLCEMALRDPEMGKLQCLEVSHPQSTPQMPRKWINFLNLSWLTLMKAAGWRQTLISTPSVLPPTQVLGYGFENNLEVLSANLGDSKRFDLKETLTMTLLVI